MGETRRPRRRKRIPRDEARRRLIDAGLELLADDGTSLGLSRISIERIVRRGDLPRASAFRAFTHAESGLPPQEHFEEALAIAIFLDYTGDDDSAGIGPAGHRVAVTSGSPARMSQPAGIDSIPFSAAELPPSGPSKATGRTSALEPVQV